MAEIAASQGRVVALRYFDAQGNPAAPVSTGVYSERREYDESDNMIATRYFDGEDKPMKGPKGWAAAQYEYNEAKQRISETFYDEEGNPCLNTDGYARVQRRYD